MKRAAMRTGRLFPLVLLLSSPRIPAAQDAASPGPMVLIPAGEFEMGDHHGFVDPKHGGDETPVHTVRLDSFHMGVFTVTNGEYRGFLESALSEKRIEVREGGVYPAGGRDLLCETRAMSPYSRIGWSDGGFSVLDHKELHPVVCIRWPGAAAYCNWLSAKQGKPPCYDPSNWDCDFTRSGYRLPTEAEWEYAARGGLRKPYRNFPCGDEADPAGANWPESGNPFRAGPLPWTTPVGFFNGKLRRKPDFAWPDARETYQTADGRNGYGLYDMTGNVWQFVNDWYGRDYYSHSPKENPPGPAAGSVMPDGKPYRGMRGGNWYNGENGHGRVSNRNPSYFRGPGDPDHPYYHLGFRVVLPVNAESRAPVALTGTPRNDGGQSDLAGPGTPGGGGGGVRPEPGGGRNDAGDRASRGFGNSPVSIALDRNADGVVDSGEIAAASGSLRALDRNNDNAVTADEIGAPGSRGQSSADGRPRSPSGPLMRIIDSDRDGDLTASEIDAAPVSLKSADTNHDGAIRREEATGRGGRNGGAPRSRPDADSPSPGNGTPPPPPEKSDREPPPEPPPVRPDAVARNPRDDRPQAGGRREMPENKPPVSPNPGQTVGLFLNTPKACPGYTLFAPKHNMVTYLMNNAGQVVHSWKSQYEPGQVVHLLPDGHLVRACMLRVQGGTGGGEGGRIEEYDWDGNLVWEFEHATRDYQLHHDLVPLPNGHILALMVERKSREQAVAAGFDANMMRDDYLVPDAVVEIEPVRPKGGKIVWEWHVWDHLVQDADRAKPGYGDPAQRPERVYVNCNGRATAAFWNHMNSLDYNARLDQISLSVRGCNEVWIIDHSTTTREAASGGGGKQGKGGDLLYRWGNPAAYKRGTQQDKQLVQQHDALWIPDGYPGAGHMTIFNNGYDRGWSSVEEIVPPVDSNGRYALEAGKPYGPAKPVWHYEAGNRTDFFSPEISGAVRLPNGNTLVCGGIVGNLFEVTPAGEMVWQYVNPMVRGGILAQGELPGKDMRGHLWNAVFKVNRYAPNHPGLKGRDLTPKGVIELPASRKGKTGLHLMTESQRTDRGPRPGGGQGGGGGNGGNHNENRAPR